MTITSPQAYEELLAAFANHTGLDAATFVKTQEIIIDGLAFGLLHEEEDGLGTVMYFANLGAPQPVRTAAIYQTLLEANNLWAGTAGATLGVQQTTGDVVIAARVAFEHLTAESLAKLLDAFAEMAFFWQRFVHSDEGFDETPPASFSLRA